MKNISLFVKWAFAIAFIIITNLFFYYAISFVAPQPVMEDFCPVRNDNLSTAETCVATGGQWTQHQLSPKEVTTAVKEGAPTGWCDPDFSCRQAFEDTKSVYNKNVFMVMIIISVIMVVGGVLIPVEVLSLGMVWSGVVALLVATVRFWSDANNLMKVIILGIGIAVLTWLAVKKMNQKE